MDWDKIPHDQCHLGDPSGTSKIISEPFVHSTQTVYLSCVKIGTISKQTEASIHLSHVTEEYHRVHLNDFWPHGTFGTNRGLKHASTCVSSPRSTIGCVQNNFWAYGTFDANRAPFLHQDWDYLQTDQNENPLEPRHLGVPLGASKMIFEPVVR
jgi:hypothetical protein